jgi:hypothetical protein
MRSSTLLWLTLAALSGATLFHTSQQVTDGRARLSALEDSTAKEAETTRVLQAEWSYLNQPDRLEKLSRQYLDLGPLQGGQFVKTENVAARPVETPPEAPASAAAPVPTNNAAAAPAVAASVPGPAPKPQAVPTPVQKPAVAANKPSAVAAAHAPVLKPPAKSPPAKPQVVKIHVPGMPQGFITAQSPAPAQKHTMTAEHATGASHRDFGDVMKSLGVE